MKTTCLATACAFAVVASMAGASSITVDYRFDLPDYDRVDNQRIEAESINLGGVTVTGSAEVYAVILNGLGVVGGSFDSIVDENESIRFTFNDAPALNVGYTLGQVSNTNGNSDLGERILEAFAPDGTSLGTVDQSGFTGEVSAAFEGQAISGFSLTSPGYDSFRFQTVTYTSAPEVVPLPAAGGMLLGALGILAGAAPRRRAGVRP